MNTETTSPESEEKKLRKVLVLKREISLNDDVIDLPMPEEGRSIRFKTLTSPILLPQGIYVVVGWIVKKKKPGVLILNHTLFPALRRWMRDYMIPVENTTFEISATSIGGVVEYNLESRGQLPFLEKEDQAVIDEYLDGLLGEVLVEVKA